MSSDDRIETFEEFWPFYVGEHRKPLTRALHYAGTALAAGTLVAAAVTANPAWLLLTPIAGYGPSWVGHFLIEGNEPATFRHPLWSLRADLKMVTLALQGRMVDEVERLYPTTPAAPSDKPATDTSSIDAETPAHTSPAPAAASVAHASA